MTTSLMLQQQQTNWVVCCKKLGVGKTCTPQITIHVSVHAVQTWAPTTMECALETSSCILAPSTPSLCKSRISMSQSVALVTEGVVIKRSRSITAGRLFIKYLSSQILIGCNTIFRLTSESDSHSL